MRPIKVAGLNAYPFTLKKRGGGERCILAPSKGLKKILRELLPMIPQGQNALKLWNYCIKGRCALDGARAHINKKMTIRLDIESFFDNVKPNKVSGLPSEIREKQGVVFYGGRLPQGFPTSTAIANIAGIPIDEGINKALKKAGLDFVYTRYIDDICISINDESQKQFVIDRVMEVVKRCGYNINKRKIKIYNARNGRRRVYGYMVDSDVHIPRAVKRRIKALKHKINNASPFDFFNSYIKLLRQFNGLTEYTKMTSPSDKKNKEKSSGSMCAKANIVLRNVKMDMHLRVEDVIYAKQNKAFEDVVLLDNPDKATSYCIVAKDPLAYLFMSCGDTWSSCLHLKNGAYRKGWLFWFLLKECAVAMAINWESIAKYGTVKYPRLKARTLVFHTSSGNYYGLFYPCKCFDPNPFYKHEHMLKKLLEEKGFKSVLDMPRYEEAVGYVRESVTLPYFDYGYVSHVKLKGKEGRFYKFYLRIPDNER